MASLANQTISSTYDGLIKTSTDQPVGISGVQLLEDGVGNSLALSVGRANQGVTITGTLSATSISGVLADGVTATTQSSGDNSTKVATTAYVDAQVTASDLDFAGDSGTGAVDLDSQSLTIAGTANEIETSASGQTITIGLPSSVTVGTLTATTLAGTLSTAAQTNITSVGTLSSLAVSGNLTVDTNTLFVDASNNRVGIGTSSPSAALTTLNGTGDGEVAIFSGTDKERGLSISTFNSSGFGQAGVDLNAQFTSAAIMTLSTGGSEAMRIDSIGNVGIGASSPAAKADIQANSTSTVPIQVINTNNNFDTNPTVSETVLRIAREGKSGVSFRSSADFGISRYENVGSNARTQLDIRLNNAQGAVPDNLIMSLRANGNVGIGTSSPVYKLQVSNSVGKLLQLNGANTTGDVDTGFTISADVSKNVYLYQRENAAAIFATNNAERMRIDSSGNVGIGTSSPNAKLDVNGDIQTRSFKTFFGDAGGNTINLLTVATDNTSGVVYLEIIYSRNNSSLRGAKKYSALTHWYSSTKGAVQVTEDNSIDININPPTVSWSGNVLQISIDTTANGGSLIINASANSRGGTLFTWA